MTYETYREDEVIMCPHCGEEQDGVADDFVIPDKETEWQEDECYNCGEFFAVRKSPQDENYQVRKQ